jgi:penicillin-binding protein 1A
VVTVEPQSGAIRTLAGQADRFNLPLDARRQPGSAFKPIVPAAALKEDISPESLHVSRELNELNINFHDENYVINNYDIVERGVISVSRRWPSRTTRSSCS